MRSIPADSHHAYPFFLPPRNVYPFSLFFSLHTRNSSVIILVIIVLSRTYGFTTAQKTVHIARFPGQCPDFRAGAQGGGHG